MDSKELEKLLSRLRAMPKETEWVEFKEAKRNYDFDDLGRYFSALSNEANLKGKDTAWLIFGIEDKNRKVVGTAYRCGADDLDKLKNEIANHTTARITFAEIYELSLPEGRVVMFKIPPAPKGIPTAWKGHYYGREGQSLGALSLQEIEQIRGQAVSFDWSAQVVKDSTIEDLDPAAIKKARDQYKHKHPHLASDIDRWDDTTFLVKARLIKKGGITNTAIILLGKSESSHLLSPCESQITWILKTVDNAAEDYVHFGTPLLVNTELVFGKIRNITYRYMPDNTLFPIEIMKYDMWVIREALHNCIAHQDYQLHGRINVVEMPDQLIFSNLGSFMPGSIESALAHNAPTEFYRNPFLAQAMVNLNMIDTIGSGIRKMFEKQRQRYFPMPDYDLTNPQRVIVRIPGKILDENYTRLLIRQADLDLATVMLLDKVQKHIKITKEQHTFLKARHLVEGRYPTIFVSAKVAAMTGQKARHIKNKGFDDQYYQDFIVKMLKEHGSVTRKDIDDLLIEKLPAILTDAQKKKKIQNLLSKMSQRDGGIIISSRCGPQSSWRLKSP
jgi:ATP-dependent DNA helicase RecG